MNFSEDDIDLYCKGKLPPQQLQELEEALKNNQRLRQDVQMRMAVIRGLRDINRSELKNTLGQYQQGHKSNKMRVVLRIAAVLIPIGVAFTWFYNSAKESDYFETYYTYYPNYEINITRGQIDTTTRAKSFIEYSQKNYERAIIGFTNNINNNSEDYASIFYRGLSYIELKKYADAMHDLELVTQSNSRFAITANWYSGLLALKLNDEEKAQVYFELLAKEENVYQQRSKEIINALWKP